MKRKNTKPKYTIGSLLILLALFIYFKACSPELEIPRTENPVETKAPAEKKIIKARKPKVPKSERYLTTFVGKVTGIKDGDTFEVLYDGQPERVRLADIDSPEKSQPFGNNAKQYASDLCFGKTVTVISTGKRDRYGRVIGTVITSEGVNVNEQLVRTGYAWHYKAYSKNKELDAIENTARKNGAGLWADKNPQEPWLWRKQKRANNQKR